MILCVFFLGATEDGDSLPVCDAVSLDQGPQGLPSRVR